MAADRPALHETAAEWDDEREPTAEEQGEEDAWIAGNRDWVRAKIQEALDGSRPALTTQQVDAHMERVHEELEAKYGR